jgi:hypothetical protein
VFVENRKYFAQGARRGHCLVADIRSREAHDVKMLVAGEREFGAAARTEQRALEPRFIHQRRCIDEQLPDEWAMRRSERAARCIGNWHVAPAGRHKPFFAQATVEFGLRARRAYVITIEEHQTCGETRAGCDASFIGERAQPRNRPMQQDAATVAGDAVGIDATAV